MDVMVNWFLLVLVQLYTHKQNCTLYFQTIMAETHTEVPLVCQGQPTAEGILATFLDENDSSKAQDTRGSCVL